MFPCAPLLRGFGSELASEMNSCEIFKFINYLGLARTEVLPRISTFNAKTGNILSKPGWLLTALHLESGSDAKTSTQEGQSDGEMQEFPGCPSLSLLPPVLITVRLHNLWPCLLLAERICELSTRCLTADSDRQGSIGAGLPRTNGYYRPLHPLPFGSSASPGSRAQPPMHPHELWLASGSTSYYWVLWLSPSGLSFHSYSMQVLVPGLNHLLPWHLWWLSFLNWPLVHTPEYSWGVLR